MIQYITSYNVPHELIDKAHPAVYYHYDQNLWKWAKQYLMSLSIKQLKEVSVFLEHFFKVQN